MAEEEESLEILIAKLNAVQSEAGVQQLNDRNAVDIIRLLQDLGKIELIYTTDGREYLTMRELIRELSDEIDAHDGRLSMEKVPPLLDVDSLAVDKAAQQLLKDRSDLTLLNGEYITDYYCEGVAREIAEILGESGMVSLSDMARRFALNTTFVDEILQARLGHTLSGTLEDEVLYQQSFIRRQEAIIRGAFTAITKPTSITGILQRHSTLHQPFFFSRVESMVENGELKGRLQGGSRGTFVPDVYDEARATLIHTFYVKNEFIMYNFLQQCGIGSPQSYLTQRYNPQRQAKQDEEVDSPQQGSSKSKRKTKSRAKPSKKSQHEDTADDDFIMIEAEDSNYPHAGIPLASCFVRRSFMEQVEPQIEHVIAVTSDSWDQSHNKDPNALVIDVLSVIPGEFSSADAQALINGYKKHIPYFDERCKLVDSYIVNTSILLPLIVNEVKSAAKDEVMADPTKYLPKGNNSTTQDDEEELTSNKKKGKGKSQKKQPQQSKSKKEEHDTGNTMQANVSKVISSLLTNYSDDALCEMLYELVEPQTQSIYDDIVQELLAAESQLIKGKRQQFEHTINSTWYDIQLYHKGISSFTACFKDYTADDMLERHLLSTLGTKLIHYMALDNALNNCDSVHDLDENLTTKQVINRLDKTAKNCLTKLYELANGKSMQTFLEELERATTECNLYRKSLDKKKERQYHQQHREDLEKKIRESQPETTDPAVLFIDICCLIYEQRHKSFLLIPGKCIPIFVKHMAVMNAENDFTKKIYTILCELQPLVGKHAVGQHLSGEEKGQLQDGLSQLQDNLVSGETLTSCASLSSQ